MPRNISVGTATNGTALFVEPLIVNQVPSPTPPKKKTFASIISRLKINAKWAYADKVKNTSPGNLTVFKCTLKINELYKMVFYMTKAGQNATPPTPDEMLRSVRDDCNAVNGYNYDMFERWARDVGQNTDSRSAEKLFKARLNKMFHFTKLIGEEEYVKFMKETRSM